MTRSIKAGWLGMQTGRVQDGTMLDSDSNMIPIAWFRIQILFRLGIDLMVSILKYKYIKGSEICFDYSFGYNFES